MANIDIVQVSKKFEGKSVLHNLNLSVKDGEFCVVIGSSGCGKSTILRLIAGLEKTTSGEILINNKDSKPVSPADRNVAMIFQDYALFPHMTVSENISFGLKFSKLSNADIKQRTTALGETLGISDIMNQIPAKLSGGQKQRVAIGRALARQPAIFLFDEPLSNLDASLRSTMRFEVSRIFKEVKQAAMVYVTHDQVEAMSMGHKILLLNTLKGADELSIAQFGTPSELFHNPQNIFAASFIGSPKMNFIDGVVVQLEKQEVLVHLQSGENCWVDVQSGDLKLDEKVVVGFRADKAEFSFPQEQSTNVVNGQVHWVEYMGNYYNIYLRQKGQEQTRVIIRVSSDMALRENENLNFSLPAKHMFLFHKDSGKAAPISIVRMLEHGLLQH